MQIIKVVKCLDLGMSHYSEAWGRGFESRAAHHNIFFSYINELPS